MLCQPCVMLETPIRYKRQCQFTYIVNSLVICRCAGYYGKAEKYLAGIVSTGCNWVMGVYN